MLTTCTEGKRKWIQWILVFRFLSKSNKSYHKITAVYYGTMWSPEPPLLLKKVSMCLSVSVSQTIPDLIFSSHSLTMWPGDDITACDSFVNFYSWGYIESKRWASTSAFPRYVLPWGPSSACWVVSEDACPGRSSRGWSVKRIQW